MRTRSATARPGLAALIAAMIGICALIAAGAARADTPVDSFSAVPSTTQAGGHPDVEIHLKVKNRHDQESTSACNCEDAKDASVHLPTGFIGNPHATPQCTIADFSADSCPIDSQVGIVEVNAGGEFIAPVYNLIPPPEDAGLLGFKVFLFNTPQFTVLSSRTSSDYGLDATATSIVHGTFPLQELREDLWGVPAAPIHDPLRIDVQANGGFSWIGAVTLCDENGAASTDDPRTIVQPCNTQIPPVASNSPLAPFLQNPTTCDSPLSTSVDVLSYDGGTSHADGTWPQPTGCDQLSFNPSLYAEPTTTETDTASGIDVNLSIPQQLSPSLPSPTELRQATVVLPPGFSINPNAADGKTSCSDAAASFGTEAAANCPEFSKVGSLVIDSSALPGPLPGYVYLGEPQPGNRYRIFLVADGFGTHIKLAGTVSPNPETGRLTISFENLPQSPLTAFNMHFFGSERGLLATPTQCGTYPVTSTFTPWDSSLGTQTSSQFFTLDSGPDGAPCPGPIRPFSPGFSAASVGNTAGSYAPFSIDLTRSDGDQNLVGLDVNTPPGFLAKLAGIPYCSDAALAAAAAPTYSGLEEQASPSCPPAAQIGTATVGAGAGTHPLYVPGKVYLAGPYKGAPVSLAVITPAVSGPYDLGNVVVRTALRIDPATAQITAVSDSFPQILEGIPLRLRSILINLDRPNFTLNPTNCDSFAVAAQVFGDQGGSANLNSPFQVSECASLAFAPKLTLRVSGGTKRAANPGIHAVLSTKPGEANIASTAVTLPHSELLDNAHLKNPCTRVQFAANACPPSSVIGAAKAETPLLEKPLEGPVYLMSGFGHKLPDLLAALKGQIDINLDGRIDTVNGGLRTSFETVPDAPVSKFTLDLKGGSKGLLENSENLCAAPGVVTERISGQSGAEANSTPMLQAPCGSKSSHARHLRRSKGWASR